MAAAAPAPATARTVLPASYKRSKDCGSLVSVVPFRPFSQLAELLLAEQPVQAPRDHGRVSLIVERPHLNARRLVPRTTLTVTGGMRNSGWVERHGVGTDDQICVMSEAAIRAITNSDDKLQWAAAGDNLFFDMHLGNDNLAVGDRVQVGAHVVLQVTPKPHRGCSKFAQRYGHDALKAVATPLARHRRLRGIYFRVVAGGDVTLGDPVRKLPNAPAA